LATFAPILTLIGFARFIIFIDVVKKFSIWSLSFQRGMVTP